LASRRAQKSPDKVGMRRAVQAFLKAAGIDIREANLKKTHLRVTDAFADEFLAGYSKSAQQVLAQRFPVSRASKNELVIVSHLRFRSMCPHHLLPFQGVAHVAYVPNREVVGFGQIAALLNVFAHRLILQEELARQVALALMSELQCAGAACIVEAQQACFQLRGEEQTEATTHAEAFEGVLQRPALRSELWKRLD
jgi:GTP cyclohydrolase IA